MPLWQVRAARLRHLGQRRAWFPRCSMDHRHDGGRRVAVELLGVECAKTRETFRRVHVRQEARRSVEQIGKHGVGRHIMAGSDRSEEHTSELQSIMRRSYAVFCLKNKNRNTDNIIISTTSNIKSHLYRMNDIDSL